MEKWPCSTGMKTHFYQLWNITKNQIIFPLITSNRHLYLYSLQLPLLAATKHLSGPKIVIIQYNVHFRLL